MILDTQNILRELAYISESSTDVVDFMEQANDYLETELLTEVQYDKVTKGLKLDILDVDKFVKANQCQVINDPRAFSKDGIPSDNGLLSEKIFGITTEERSNIFGYIDLHGYFLDPSCYKAWVKIDNKIRNIVHGIGYYRINDRGEIVEDANEGKTGIEFLRKNINKIKFISGDSLKRDIRVKYLERNRDKMFINKYIVIPPFYRDKNTSKNKTVGLGGINKLYNNLILASQALTATKDYMFDASDAMNARVQETILTIYDWFCGNSNASLPEDSTGSGLSRKLGIFRRTTMAKTSDFSSRLVLSACQLKAERPEDMMVNFDRSAVPLSSCIANFRDFVTYQVKRFFDNEFVGRERYPIVNKSGDVVYVELDSPEIEFSTERIREEMEKFIHGYNNRFVPIELPVKGTDEKYYMTFKGYQVNPKEAKTNPESIYHRRLTWCDVFFIACTEATQDKHVVITRFPINLVYK